MNGKHTPGPWKALDRYTNRQAVPVGCERPESGGLAHNIFAEAHGHNCEANARLIASSPELLQALESVMVFSSEHACECREVVGLQSTCPFCQARAAIAKAKGEK